jgi:hypothetical protein
VKKWKWKKVERQNKKGKQRTIGMKRETERSSFLKNDLKIN